jgi:hypothetical protein
MEKVVLFFKTFITIFYLKDFNLGKAPSVVSVHHYVIQTSYH